MTGPRERSQDHARVALGVVLLLLGVAGYASLRERFDPSLASRPALGAFWRARDPLGWPLLVAPDDPAVARGLTLAPDARLQLVIGGPMTVHYDTLHLEFAEPGPALLAEGASAAFLDAVHPTARGHLIIARELLPAVRAALPGH